jgi:hypothetical protein
VRVTLAAVFFSALAAEGFVMGIVVDLSRSKVTFKEGLLFSNLNPIKNFFSYEMHSFAIEFGIAFDPDPAKGFGGATKNPDDWRIGIVQNVLYEGISFVFHGGKPLVFENHGSRVDMVDGAKFFPFYANPNPKGAPPTQPVADTTITPGGFGQVHSRIDKKPEVLNSWDQPSGGGVYKQGSIIQRYEKTVSFQAWLVARKPGLFSRLVHGGDHILAHIPAFSLSFWFETDLSHYKHSQWPDPPDYKWGAYGEAGYFPNKKV